MSGKWVMVEDQKVIARGSKDEMVNAAERMRAEHQEKPISVMTEEMYNWAHVIAYPADWECDCAMCMMGLERA